MNQGKEKNAFLNQCVNILSLKNVTVQAAIGETRFSGLVLIRAFLKPEKLLLFMRKHLLDNASFTLCLTENNKDLLIPSYFEVLKTIEYELPEGNGKRILKIVKNVPRGTLK